MGLVIVCGDKGEGKTSYVCRYAAHATDYGRSVGGIASPAVFSGDKRIGYDLVDLHGGTRWSLARAVSEAEAPTVGIYRFDEAAVAAGNSAITSAVRDGLDVIAVDEVGPLEFRGAGWAPALGAALRDCRSDQELIVVVRAALLGELPNRFPSPLWEEARRVSPPWPSVIRE